MRSEPAAERRMVTSADPVRELGDERDRGDIPLFSREI
jgi:hypothetical protein